MHITDVHIKLVRNRADKLRAFCSIILNNSFILKELKIIEGKKSLFVAMPSRKLTTRCKQCSTKVALTDKFCSECGKKLKISLKGKNNYSSIELYSDIAHPISKESRAKLEDIILDAYNKAIQESEHNKLKRDKENRGQKHSTSNDTHPDSNPDRASL